MVETAALWIRGGELLIVHLDRSLGKGAEGLTWSKTSRALHLLRIYSQTLAICRSWTPFRHKIPQFTEGNFWFLASCDKIVMWPAHF